MYHILFIILVTMLKKTKEKFYDKMVGNRPKKTGAVSFS